MNKAIFGLGNTLLDLFVTLALISLVAIWGALIVFTFNDARKRLSDPFLIACATAGSFFPFVGTLVYTILRPQELLDDVQEREWDLKATQAVLRQHRATSCRKCGYPAEPDFTKCPSCRSRLREPCPSCDRPVGIEWKLCPYCEKTLIEPTRKSSRRKEARESGRSKDPERTSRSGATRSRTEAGSKAAGSSGEARKPSKGPAQSGQKKAGGGTRSSRGSRGSGAGSRKPSAASEPESPTAEEATPRRSGSGGGPRRSTERPINSPESSDRG